MHPKSLRNNVVIDLQSIDTINNSSLEVFMKGSMKSVFFLSHRLKSVSVSILYFFI